MATLTPLRGASTIQMGNIWRKWTMSLQFLNTIATWGLWQMCRLEPIENASHRLQLLQGQECRFHLKVTFVAEDFLLAS